MAEKGEELSNLARDRKEEDINAILERTSGQPTERDSREIKKIQNRRLIPGKWWFLQFKPGKNEKKVLQGVP